MKIHRLLLLAITCTWTVGAAAQWQWIDKDGRKVFSDRAPPQEIPEKNILKQPGGSRTAATVPLDGPQKTTATPVTAPVTPAATTPVLTAPGTSKDKELEEKKAQAEAVEAAKKKAEDAKIAKSRAENCTRAQAAKATFDSGRPVTQSNAQGERIFLDVPARAAEVKRINEIIASDCAR